MTSAPGELAVSIVLPAHNEEPNIEQAIGEATRTAAVVRESASRDSRMRLVGHGRSLAHRLSQLPARHVLFTDADLQFDMQELERLLPFIGTVDVVAGYRLNRQDSPSRRAMAYGWNLLMRVLFYVPVRDIDCAFKLFDKRVLEEIDIESVGAMVSTELMVKLGRRGASVVEIGVSHRPRLAGEARGASPRVIARAFIEVVRMRRRLASLDGREL